MKVSKKNVKYNVLMALAVLFAICYQSLHIFTDEAHHFHDEVTQEHTSKTHLSHDTIQYFQLIIYYKHVVSSPQ